MKNKYFGSDDIITVYKFMERCGLHCETKGNIAVSHEIMMKKINSRHQKFPDSITVPKAISFKEVEKDEVKRGKIILVQDDLKNIVPYIMPILSLPSYTENELEIIRLQNIKEQLLKEQEVNQEQKPGYIKYLQRQERKNKQMRKGE